MSVPYILSGLKKAINGGSLLLFSLFGILCIGMLYTENTKEGLAIIERHQSLLVFPFLLSTFSFISRKQKQKLLNVFVYSAALAGLFCLGHAGYDYLESGTVYPTGQTGHFTYNRFMHHRLSSAIGMHAIYFSFYCSIAGIAVLQKLLFAPKIGIKWRLTNGILFLFFIVLLFLLKSSLFAFAFPLSCLLLLFIKLKNQLLKPKYAIGFLIICCIAALLSYQGIRSKLDTFKTTYAFTDTSMRPLAMRMALWSSTWQAIQEEPLLGVGTGDGDEVLIEEFKRVGFVLGEQSRFNAHNMYLQYWLSNGVVCTSLFIAFLLLLFIKALRHQNFIFFAFTLFFAFFSITESTMLKQKGVVFFTFFALLFLTDPNCWAYSTQETHENNSSS